MSVASPAQPGQQWTIDAFKAFWAKPNLSRVPAVLSVLTDDVVGYWPRPIGTVQGARPYVTVIADILTVFPDFSLVAAEHATTGDFTFVRWIATGTGPQGRVEFSGCDRVRTRRGLVCENYIFCDHPFFS
jgi:hypothetical protein